MISDRRRSLWATLVMACTAHAQRVDENAVEQAQDAFGLSVGQESIGLYSPDDARGFSPQEAGNLVIEGLYFDQQTFRPSRRVIESSTVAVGLGAQSYPFAAPTGIVEYRLRMPGNAQITSVAAGIGPHDQAYTEADMQFPLGNQVSVGLGLGYEHNPYRLDAQESREPSAGAIVRWQPHAASHVVAFAGWSARHEDAERPLVFLHEPFLPAKFEQDELRGQQWTYWDQDSFDYGVLARTDLSSRWTVRAGAFGSTRIQHDVRNEYLFVTQPDGLADYFIVGVPRQTFESTSGELRLSRIAQGYGRSRHLIHFVGRVRDGSLRYGGDDEHFIGSTRITQRVVVPEQSFSTGPTQLTENTHLSLGAAYVGMWDEIGELSVGVQRSRFDRATQDIPDAARLRSSDATWLYNGTFAAHLARTLTLFGSYSRGLEESGTAPENAVNRRQSTPLVVSEQIDLGLRYQLDGDLSLVVAGFQIDKPYYGVNAQQIFAELGLVRHRGLEASLTGELLENLDVVIGVVHIDAGLSGASVDTGETGKTPVGPVPDVISANFSYSPPAWSGFALEGSLRHSSARVASRDNTLVIPATTELDTGFRYKFQSGRWRMSLRFQAMNLTDRRSWEIEPSGQARLSEARRYSLSITADR